MTFNYHKYKFKLRSLPNSKTFSRYLNAYMIFLGVVVVYNFVTICLAPHGFEFTFPGFFVLAIPLIFVHIYTTIEGEFLSIKRDTMKEVIGHIRLNQTQSLIEKLDDNPELLKETFKKKSLLYWARYHKNAEANAVLISHLKRHTKP